MPKPPPGIELHLYCHGLGDCHLLKLSASNGADKWVMIDCGIHTSMPGGANRIRTVAEDVQLQTGGKLAAIVGTHEHWDHISAFEPSQNLFSAFTVGEVWLGWTENPGNDEAKELDKYKGMALGAVRAAERALPSSQATADSPDYSKLKGALLGVEGFMGVEPGAKGSSGFGLKGERVRDARDGLVALASPPQYLNPGDVFDVTDEVRCYVLAPPHDTNFGLLDSASLTYNAAASAPLLVGLRNALRINDANDTFCAEEDPLSPFDSDEGEPLDQILKKGFLRDHYSNEPWRTIDHDWLMPATDLALQLDSKTNNTSLVLAFEIVGSGHVLIFAADAQIGNWKTWAGVEFPKADSRPATTGKDLMERAVFYKVGHHGSRNATMSTNGLELMNKLELAFNPTDRVMATNVGWDEIPAEGLNAELIRRTSNHLIESDRLTGVTPASFGAGGALGTPVTIRTAKGSSGRPDIPCVECRII